VTMMRSKKIDVVPDPVDVQGEEEGEEEEEQLITFKLYCFWLASEHTPLERTSGKLCADEEVCIVSFPAMLEQDTWNVLTGQTNFACVWTGNNDSPREEWFGPWVKNVEEAVKRRMKLLVIVSWDTPKECQPRNLKTVEIDELKLWTPVVEQYMQREQFQLVTPRGRNMTYVLGAGQKAELRYLNDQGIDYKVWATTNRNNPKMMHNWRKPKDKPPMMWNIFKDWATKGPIALPAESETESETESEADSETDSETKTANLPVS